LSKILVSFGRLREILVGICLLEVKTVIAVPCLNVFLSLICRLIHHAVLAFSNGPTDNSDSRRLRAPSCIT